MVMWIRTAILGIELLMCCYHLFLNMRERRWKRPLPKEVANIFSEERYQTFRDKEADRNRAEMQRELVSLGITALLLLSPFYRWMEQLSGGGIYRTVVITITAVSVIDGAANTVFSYRRKFLIDEKYGMNRETVGAFLKRQLIALFFGSVLKFGMFLLITWMSEGIGHYLQKHPIGYMGALLITGILLLAVYGLGLLLNLFGVLSLRIKYRFTELEDGPLRRKITEMLTGVRRKVRRIRVYNESSRSVRKNAFVMKLPFYCEIGIADNYLNENSEAELLAVLAHEIGHLKEKRHIGDYAEYIEVLIFAAAMCRLIPNADLLRAFSAVLRTAFSLEHTNYYLLFMTVFTLLHPLLTALSVLSNCNIRRHEYEADGYSVALGYGLPLKEMFTKVSSDELINVDPDPIVEFLTYDHPGMYQRIKAIDAKIAEYEKRNKEKDLSGEAEP